ncbi:MAG TPA: hypothetical protein DIV86_02190 [Alphaproteobacteria bacterium]|nr:hypothetical protein [Alphaproteobacteria bacterium]
MAINQNNFRTASMKKGFTLVELAIVIIIVGLIIGGILAGQNLLNNAERQKVVKEFQKYNNAMSSFKQQYNALPGDMANATTYWTGLDSWHNGDGDGYIEGFDGECLYVPVLLNTSELLNEKINLSTGGYVLPSKIKGTRFFVCSTSADWDTENGYSGIASGYSIYDKTGNYLSLAPFESSDYNGPLAAETAIYIDQKIDDGKASSGNMVAIRGFNSSVAGYQASGCITGSGAGFAASNTEGTISYDLSSKVRACRLIFWLHHLD